MENRIIIIGHAGFPDGIKSSLEFICGFEKGLVSYMIDNDHDDQLLKKNITKEFLSSKDFKIIFADLPGGSPHQTVVQLISEKNFKNVIIIAGAGFSFMMDITMKVLLIGVKDINEIKNYIQVKMKDLNKYIFWSIS